MEKLWLLRCVEIWCKITRRFCDGGSCTQCQAAGHDIFTANLIVQLSQWITLGFNFVFQLFDQQVILRENFRQSSLLPAEHC